MSGGVYTDCVYEIASRNNVLRKNYEFSHFGLPNEKKKKYLTIEDCPFPAEGCVLLGNFHFGVNSWEYRSLSGWSFQSLPSVFFKKRRRQWARIFYSPTEIKEKKVLKFDLFEGEERREVQVEYDSRSEYYQKTQERKLRPNILIIGGSGCGKSSLVNAVFGKPLAEIGSGKPVTQEYTQYGSLDDNESPVVIYDSKGIEHGRETIETFLQDTQKFFQKLNVDKRLETHIHVVWYVIDLTQTRFQPFEADFCKDTLKNYPVVFIFNKADAVKKEVMDIMVETVKGLEIPNSLGELSTVADRKNFDVKQCPKCDSPKIRKRLKASECTVLCKECKEKTLLKKTENVELLKQLTLDQKSRIIALAFVEAANARMKGFELDVKTRILINSEENVNLASSSQAQVSKVMAMCESILEVYKMKFVSQVWESYLDRAMIIFFKGHNFFALHLKVLGDSLKKKNNIGKALTVLTGVFLANSCVLFHKNFAQAIVDGEKEEIVLDKLIVSSLKFLIEAATLKIVLNEIKKNEGVFEYLSKLPFDGSFQLATVDKKDEEKEEEIEIFTKYQEDEEIQNSENDLKENSKEIAKENEADIVSTEEEKNEIVESVQEPVVKEESNKVTEEELGEGKKELGEGKDVNGESTE